MQVSYWLFSYWIERHNAANEYPWALSQLAGRTFTR